MKKLYYLIVLTLILGLVLTGCLLSNVGQVPTTEQSGIAYLTKALPLSADLVGLWHFSDNLTDSSGNDNHGTFEGGGVADYSDSPMGRALSFNGISDYVSVGDIEVIGDWTVEFWAKLASTDKTIYYPIGLSPASPTNGSGIFLAYSGDKWGVYDGVHIVWSSSAVSTNTWYHFAVTKSGTIYTLYRDGTYEGAGSLADIDITNLNIGRRSDSYWYFQGIIDEVRIWKVALSEGQLRFIYEFGGFFPPVENPPTVNMAKAGRAIPVKFSLNGDQGLDIFEPGYPKSVEFFCSGESDPNAIIVGTDAAGGSILSYDAIEDEYVYVWKTEKKWAEQCRQLVVRLNDGKSYYANFQFK